MNPAKEGKPKTPSLVAGFLPISWDIDLSCSYYPLVKFLNALENHSLLISVNELDIVRNEKDILSHKIKLSLMSYVSKR
jgi:hypothetical protein